MTGNGQPLVARCDIVLEGGRVIDPETGLDAVRSVGVTGGVVACVQESVPAARKTLDCTGLVVAPGFIDMHSHAQTLTGSRLQALDGVTTALDLEAGAIPTRPWYDVIAEQGRPINHGYSASWSGARAQVFSGLEMDPRRHPTGFAAFQAAGRDSRWRRPGTPFQVGQVLDLLERSLAQGAIGIGLLLGYLPDTDHAELLQIATLAERFGVGAFVHSRSALPSGDFTALDAVVEIIDAAGETGASVHLCHMNSTSGRSMDAIVAAMTGAQRQGLPVTTEVYPYNRGSTVVGAPFLSSRELAREGRTPDSLIYAATGEVIADEARLNELRATDPGGIVLTLTFSESDAEEMRQMDLAMSLSSAAFASDAMPAVAAGEVGDDSAWPPPSAAFAHPRSAGCFAKVFRWLVRERGLISLPEAVRRCTLVPADILASSAPVMNRKGRIQVGMDADIVAFDPVTFTDHATYRRLLPSSGVRHLLVGGVPVVVGGKLRLDAMPGRAIYGGGRGYIP
jgi:N-acyl-D-aspartate/D-glutamate deacylase